MTTEDKRPRYSEAIKPLVELHNAPDQKYAQDKNEITAELLEELCNNNPEVLKAPKNKSCFWCDVAIKNVSEKLNPTNQEKKLKYANYEEFWQNQRDKVYQVFFRQKQEYKDIDKLLGENVAQIVIDNMKIYSLRSLVNFIDGGSTNIIGGDNKPKGPWGIASKKFAQNAEGIVTVISGERPPIDTSIWSLIELPTLMKNKNVDMIVEIDNIKPDRIKSIRFTNKLNLRAFQDCDIRIPVDVSNELKKQFSGAKYVALKDIYKKIDKEYIHINPCIVKYSKDGKIKYNLLNDNGKEKNSYEDLQKEVNGNTMYKTTQVSKTSAKEEKTKNNVSIEQVGKGGK